jgi:hypothetical protein
MTRVDRVVETEARGVKLFEARSKGVAVEAEDVVGVHGAHGVA